MLTKTEQIRILNDTKDIIKAGWCRGSYKKGDRHCTIGALGVACGATLKPAVWSGVKTYDFDNYSGELDQMVKLLESRLDFEDEDGYYCWSLDEWNDDQPSKKPVLALIDRTIKELSNV